MQQPIIKDAIDELHTIHDMLRWAMCRFHEANIYCGHGTDNYWDEAVQLILPTLFLPIDVAPEIGHTRLTRTERLHVVEMIIQRIEKRIPTAYLTQRAWFCGHEFYVDQRVLIPRSPIGELIGQKFAHLIAPNPRYILDMCTGSGCIAIACAYAFPQTAIDAVDISADALAVAEWNIEQHGLVDQVTPMQSDLFRDLVQIPYDLIIANPPYVDEEDMQAMPQEYRHEPALGLTAGQDGLHLIHTILIDAARYLSATGVLICEVGNSKVHLLARYPEVAFNWITFQHGGEGVFTLTRQQLIDYQSYFIAQQSAAPMADNHS